MVDSGKDREGEPVPPTAELLRLVPGAVKIFEAQLRKDAEELEANTGERLAEVNLKDVEQAIAQLGSFSRLVEKALQGGFRVAVNDSRDYYLDRGRIMTTRIRLGDPNQRIGRDPNSLTEQLSFFLSTGGGETRAEAISGISSRGVGANKSKTLPPELILDELEQRATPDTSININGIGLHYDDSSRVIVRPTVGISFQHRTGESRATVHGLRYVGNTPFYSSLDRQIKLETFSAKESAFTQFPRANLTTRR